MLSIIAPNSIEALINTSPGMFPAPKQAKIIPIKAKPARDVARPENKTIKSLAEFQRIIRPVPSRKAKAPNIPAITYTPGFGSL